MCLTSSARRSVNSWRPIISEVARAQSWNCIDDGLLAMVGKRPCSASRTIWVQTPSRRTSRGVCAERSFQQAMIRSSIGRPISPRPQQKSHPGQGGRESAAGRSAQPDDLESILNAPPEEGLQRAGDEGALTPPSLTSDGNAFAGHGSPL